MTFEPPIETASQQLDGARRSSQFRINRHGRILCSGRDAQLGARSSGGLRVLCGFEIQSCEATQSAIECAAQRGSAKGPQRSRVPWGSTTTPPRDPFRVPSILDARAQASLLSAMQGVLLSACSIPAASPPTLEHLGHTPALPSDNVAWPREI